MIYRAVISHGVFGGTGATQRANLWASWGLRQLLPQPVPISGVRDYVKAATRIDSASSPDGIITAQAAAKGVIASAMDRVRSAMGGKTTKAISPRHK
jgi:hypothetical protein